MSERILRRRQVEARVGLSRSTIYEMMVKGNFPAPIKLGARAVGWIEAEISEWLDVRKGNRPQGLSGVPADVVVRADLSRDATSKPQSPLVEKRGA